MSMWGAGESVFMLFANSRNHEKVRRADNCGGPHDATLIAFANREAQYYLFANIDALQNRGKGREELLVELRRNLTG